MQTSYYAKLVDGQQYGVAIDSSTSFARTGMILVLSSECFHSIRHIIAPDWMLFTAATMTDPAIQNSYITCVHNYASSQQNVTPFALEYVASDGIILTALAGLNR